MLSKKEILKTRTMLTGIDTSMAVTFKALSDTNRYKIFCILTEQPQVTVGAIAKILNISLPLASQHIKVLAHAGLVQKERTGKRILTKLKYHDTVTYCITTAIKKIIKIKLLKKI